MTAGSASTQVLQLSTTTATFGSTCNIDSSKASLTLLATPTTITMGGSCSTVSIGASTGVFTANNALISYPNANTIKMNDGSSAFCVGGANANFNTQTFTNRGIIYGSGNLYSITSAIPNGTICLGVGNMNQALSIADENLVIGMYCMGTPSQNITGNYNCCVGGTIATQSYLSACGGQLYSGSYNAFFGAKAGNTTTTGSSNTSIGARANAGTTGSNNSCFGYNSGTSSSMLTLTTQSNKTVFCNII